MNWLIRKAKTMNLNDLTNDIFDAIKENMESPDSVVFEKDINDVTNEFLSIINYDLQKAVTEKVKQAGIKYKTGGWK